MPRILIGMAVLAASIMAGDTATSYTDTIRAWQKHRDEGLRAEKGWLTLVGLYRLKPGDNTIGSAADCDFVLPKTAAAHVGVLQLSDDKVTFTETSSGAKKTLAYKGDNPDTVVAGSVSFIVIKRGDRYGIRARDSASPVLKNFEGMSYFPINPALRFEAKLIPDVQKIPILNVLGQTEMEESPGLVEFTLEGHAYHLRPIYEETANGKTLFFLFKDLTNKTSTYPAGRMLNVPLPVDGKVDLDFNRSYNPPCTFTPYATCPLPPKENHLPIAINAGELRYKDGHPYETSSK
jgi:uncharacterized protein (DUF1684 family)